MKRILTSLLVAFGLFNMTSARHDVRDYGAVAEDDSLETERANAKAFMKALAAAN